jgi:hypothetical protein
MSASLHSVPSHGHALDCALTIDDLRQRAPAVFASAAHATTSARYTFIPTERVLRALTNVGFVAVDVRQARTRRASALHARHVVRLRRRIETVHLRDAVPEILFLNSHDGSCAHELRLGLYRVVCTNGLIASTGNVAGYRIAHRGDVVDEVVGRALELAERFGELAAQVERMEARRMHKDEQIELAERAVQLRWPDPSTSGLQPSQLLTCRRLADTRDDLWTTTNVVQENLMAGGLSRRSPSGRLVRTRRLSAIRETVRLNVGVWKLATSYLPAA